MGWRLPVILLLCVALGGCGTTRWTDTSRSATEQLLISDAMDRAVSDLDFRALAGKTVYLDAKPLQGVTDSAYLISSLRQHMLASGCVLKDAQAEAEYIVEVRSGAVGTDHHELVYGVPRVDIPALLPVSGFGIPTNIPEIRLVTRSDKRAMIKIAVFAYNRQTGRPVWQSGIVPTESDAKATWIFGAGPFQRGSIYEGTNFAGDELKIPLIDPGKPEGGMGSVSVADEAYFIEPKKDLVQKAEKPEPGEAAQPSEAAKAPDPQGGASNVIQTGHTSDPASEGKSPAPPTDPPPAQPPPAETPPAGALPASSPPSEKPTTTTPPSGTPPTDPPATETSAAETSPSNPAATGTLPPATVSTAVIRSIREPGIQPSPPNALPMGRVAPLPPTISPFDLPNGLAPP